MKIPLLFGHQLKLYLSKEYKRTGVCSKVFKTDEHCLLGDFDYVEDFSGLLMELDRIQHKYKLPDIHVIQSSIDKYHIYCFCARPFMEIVHILSDIKGLDKAYFRLGIIRGYFTLRISERENEKFEKVALLMSLVPPDISPLEVTTNEYLTSNKGGKQNAKR